MLYKATWDVAEYKTWTYTASFPLEAINEDEAFDKAEAMIADVGIETKDIYIEELVK